MNEQRKDRIETIRTSAKRAAELTLTLPEDSKVRFDLVQEIAVILNEVELASGLNNEPCSETFQDAVCDGGGLVHDCELCGRTHYATHEPNIYEEGELEALEAKHEANPEKYNACDASGVSYGQIAGMVAVYGCPCGWRKVRRYEDVVSSHKEIIARYFRKCAEEARRDLKVLEQVAKDAAS